MADYQAGHIKRDPDTGAAALRTTFPETDVTANLAWLIASPNRGARTARTADVEAWDDLYTPGT